jgi:hypothetical protein
MTFCRWFTANTYTFRGFQQPKLAWICIKKQTKRQVEACLPLCLTVFWLSVRRSVRPSIHVPMSLQSRDHRTPSQISENCTSLAALLEVGIGLLQGLYLRRTKQTQKNCKHVFTPRMSFEFTLQTYTGWKTADTSQRAVAPVATYVYVKITQKKRLM